VNRGLAVGNHSGVVQLCVWHVPTGELSLAKELMSSRTLWGSFASRPLHRSAHLPPGTAPPAPHSLLGRWLAGNDGETFVSFVRAVPDAKQSGMSEICDRKCLPEQRKAEVRNEENCRVLRFECENRSSLF
jgi:hypothetical protein